MAEDTVYSISTGMKIFYGLLGAGMLGFALFLLSMGTGVAGPLLYLFPAVIAVGGIMIFINLAKRKVIISDTSITNINVFIKRELLFSEIKGCRIGQKALTLESTFANKKKIIIGNYSDLDGSKQLAAWVKDNFTDLDAVDLKQNEEKILTDPTLGHSEDDRKAKLKTAKFIAITYNIVGFAGAFALLFIAGRRAAVIMGLIYPLFAILIMKFSKGLIKFVGNTKRSVNPYLMLGFMGSALPMLFNSFDDYQVFQYDNLWLYFAVVIVIICGLIYITGINTIIGGIKGQIFVMLIMAAIYGFGCVTSINCTFDNSIPKVYKAVVLDRRIEQGRHTSYLVTITEWGPMHKQKEEDVGRWLYNRVSIGDTVKINFRPGILKAPWYQVDQYP